MDDTQSSVKLWTVWLDYFATGEGRTLFARVAYAESQRTALEGFEEVFGEFYARGAYAAEGVVGNGVTRVLFSTAMLEKVSQLEGRANVDLFAQFHFNLS